MAIRIKPLEKNKKEESKGLKSCMATKALRQYKVNKKEQPTADSTETQKATRTDIEKFMFEKGAALRK